MSLEDRYIGQVLPLIDLAFSDPDHAAAFTRLGEVRPYGARWLAGRNFGGAIAPDDFDLRVTGPMPKGAAILRAIQPDGRPALVLLNPAQAELGTPELRRTLNVHTSYDGHEAVVILAPVLGHVPDRVQLDPRTGGFVIRSNETDSGAVGIYGTRRALALAKCGGWVALVETERGCRASHTLAVVDDPVRPCPPASRKPTHGAPLA